jgi:hypothetical protein
MPINPTVGELGTKLRAVTKSVTQEPLPAAMVGLLIQLELLDEKQAEPSDGHPHRTSTREPKKW